MQIQYYHFLSIFKPVEIIKATKTLRHFSKSLTRILIQELAEGNKIVGVSTGWPSENSIIVSLQFSFLKDYQEDGVCFIPKDDLHYGGSKYISDNPRHILSTSQNND